MKKTLILTRKKSAPARKPTGKTLILTKKNISKPHRYKTRNVA